jgi:hypothetical protein
MIEEKKHRERKVGENGKDQEDPSKKLSKGESGNV